MAVAVSLINTKGGVGETTLAAQIAHAAANRKLRTLAVDLRSAGESESGSAKSGEVRQAPAR